MFPVLDVHENDNTTTLYFKRIFGLYVPKKKLIFNVVRLTSVQKIELTTRHISAYLIRLEYIQKLYQRFKNPTVNYINYSFVWLIGNIPST